ncbi:peptide upstream protein [Thalictrum thalictroides]|uniref:Peptide upstream protein n=1 Tax=Thalictrum thalictroides TaxID=46969 RepID=A0A7J6WYN2_THATH|nr:peptide upstream protein [Thalictrum thalictroides]
MNISELHSTFTNLLDGNWLNHHFKAALIVGKDSIKAVMVMRKLGFREAIGVDRKPCTSMVKKGSIYGLPFKDNSFDFVFSMAMIDGVRVPARMVLEMERVLKPTRVGVVLRRVSGSVPTRDVMKAAAPVASYLKFSNIVDVRTLNRTVMVIFKKRSLGIGDGDGDGRLSQVVLMPEEKVDSTLLSLLDSQ